MDTGRYFTALITRAKECNLTLHLNESYGTPHDSENLFSRIEAGDFCVEAQGTSLTAARDKASIQMLEKLESLAPNSNKNTVPVDKSPTELERPKSVDKSPKEIENCAVKTKPCDRPDFGLGKDPTMRLSELQMVRKQPYATYRQLQGEIKGAELLFSIEAALDQFTAVGTGATKKEAKRRASTALLQKMGYQVPETDLLDLTAPQTSSPLLQTLREEPTPVDRSLQKQDTVNQSQTTAPPTSKRNKTPVHIGPDFGLGKDPCSRLSELQMVRKQPYATYRQLQGDIKGAELLFSIEAALDQFTAVGTGATKKEAKRRASTALLQKMGYQVPETDLLDLTTPQTSSPLLQTLREEPTPVDRSLQKQDTVNQSQTTAPPTSKRNKTPVHIGPDFGLGKDPCSRLSELQMVRKQPYATYRQLQGEIKGAELLFSIEAALDQFTAVGTGSTKKEAKRRASTALLQKMGYQVPETDLLDLTAPQTSSPLLQTLREEPTPVDRSLQKQDTVNQSQTTAPPTSKKNKTPVHIGPDFGLGKDPCSRLSELQMVRKQPYATYRQLQGEIKGAELLFSIEAALDQFTAVGTGATKKEAKRRASTALLQKMGYQVPETDLLDLTAPQTSSPLLQTLREEPTPVDRSLQKQDTVNQSQTTAPPTSKKNKTPVHIGPDFGLGKDPCSRLSELQMVRKQPYATYRQLQGEIKGAELLFSIEAALDQFTAVGTGATKKEAKRRASTALLQKMGYQVPETDLLDLTTPQTSSPLLQTLREEPTPVDRSLQKQDTVNQSQTTAPATSKRNKTPVHIGPDFGLGKDPCSRLSELQMLRRETYAVYRMLEEKVVDNNYMFTIEASLNQFTGTGNGRTKKEAKKRASTALLLKMGFTVPEEDLLIENVSQTHQVTSERHSREDQRSEDTSPSQERAENLDCSEENSQDHQASAEHSESQAGEEQSPVHGSEAQREQQTPEDIETCSSETSQNNITAPEKPTEVKTPEGPRDDVDESVTAEELVLQWTVELHVVAPLSTVAPDTPTDDSDTSEDSQTGILDQGPEETSPGVVQTLGDSLKDAEYPDQSPLLWSNSETSPTSEELSSADFSCYQDSSSCADHLWLDGISKLFQSPKGSQISEELQIFASSESRWLDGLSDIFQSPVEVPEGEIVEKIPETSDSSSSEGHQSPSETQSAGDQENLDENTNPESTENRVETQTAQDAKIPEKTQLSENSTEQEGQEEVLTDELCKVIETTEAGEILPDHSVETDPDSSADSETGLKIRSPENSQEDLSDGHHILQEIFNLALNSPLWAESPEDVNEDLTEELHIDSEIPELSHTDESMNNIFDIYEDSYESPEEPSCPEDICSVDYQSLGESQDSAPENQIESKILHDPREDLCDEDSKLHAVPESTEAPESVSDRTLENFVIRVMVKKLLKNRPTHLRSYHGMLVDLLVKAAQDHFKVPEGVRLKPKNVQKLGKAAARDLMHEYGGSLKVLLAAVGTKTVEFQEDAVKHLNIRLNAFKNRPKSGLKRFFSKWDKPCY